MQPSELLTPELQKELVEFTQTLVRIQSPSGQEGEIIQAIANKMAALGYEQVSIDAMGNLLGRIGSAGKAILFDSHVDVVAVNDAEAWDYPPFSGVIVDGRLHGRGSVDMKSGAAAAIIAGAIAKRLGFASGKTVYVSCSVNEEDCDGENLKHLFKELDLKPDFVVVCEPSNNQIAVGHKGKIQLSIKTHGVSAHGSAPEKGVNAIYEMAEIIQRVEKANLARQPKDGLKGSLIVSRISSVSASLNAVPSECEAYIDWRLVPGETEESLRREIEQIIQDKHATWQVGTLHRRSWTGLEFSYRPFHLAWMIDLDHELARTCKAAYREHFGRQPGAPVFWDFSTNAVAPVSLGIATIGFGPGDQSLAHMRNEHCEVQQILDACGFYVRLIQAV